MVEVAAMAVWQVDLMRHRHQVMVENFAFHTRQ
jgi:hypothetical protein